MGIQQCCGDSCPEFKSVIEEICRDYPNIFDENNSPLEIVFRKIWNTALGYASDHVTDRATTDYGLFLKLMG